MNVFAHCFHLASKLTGARAQTPTVEVLELLVNGGGDIDKVNKWELSLFDYYGWRLERINKGTEIREYLDERSKLLQFLKDNGAKSEVGRVAAEKAATKRRRAQSATN